MCAELQQSAGGVRAAMDIEALGIKVQGPPGGWWLGEIVWLLT